MANSVEKALYIVATPIGNLNDITLRALDVLKNVDIIACEDTRTTSILLNKYSINTKLISYHKFSEKQKSEVILNYLFNDKSIALVSDAGTPLICDPGSTLVDSAIKNGFKIIPIPGPSAIITFLSAVNKEGEDFKFIGFLPRVKNQIIETFLKNKNENLIFYQSPNRLLETLEILKDNFPSKKIAVARELTKKFEEIKIDCALNLFNFYTKNPPKGEIVVMLYKGNILEESNNDSMDNEELNQKIKKLKDSGFKDKEISLILSKLYDVSKNAVYDILLEKKKSD